ncbi:MAG: MFS transporter [Actinobacteria bacterium]|nr:MFS transporter [Actinomycetota bacterium]
MADDGTISKQTWIAIGAMALAVFAIANDFTAMNVALSTIERELDTDLATVQWVVNGYALVFGVLIVPGGRLADLFGRTKILFVGSAVFAGFSLLGGIAPNVYFLIGARLFMGIGGALMWPAILGLIYAIMPESKAGLAGGLVIGIAGIGNAAGPIIAGALTVISWRLIFFLNVPIALAAIVVVWRAVSVENPTEREPIDYAGTVLLSVSLMSLLGGLTTAPTAGFSSPLVAGAFVLSAVTMVLFVLRERAAKEAALVPPSVIGNRPFLWACLSTLAMSATFFATLLYLPQFFQKILGAGTLGAGLMIFPFVGVFAMASFIETWLLNRIGMKAVITIGAACIFGGPLLFVLLLDQTSGYASLIAGMVVLGIGVGLFYSAVTTAALTALDPSKSSLAGGLLYMFQVAGGAVGLGITTAVFLVGSNTEITQGASDVGVTLSRQQVNDVQGVLAGTDTSQQLVSQFPGLAVQLNQVVRDAFVSGLRWAFALDFALAFVGLVFAAFRVAGPLSSFGRDVAAAGTAEQPASHQQSVPHRHRTHRHTP